MAAILTPAAGPIPNPNSLFDYHTSMQVQDDFAGGGTTDGAVGTLGWGLAGTYAASTGTANNPGQGKLSTGAVSGTIGRLNLFGGLPFIMSNEFDLTWIFKMDSNDANTTVRFGIANTFNSNPGANGVYLEKLDADTNWFAVTRASSTDTRVDTGIAVQTTSFVTLRITRVGVTAFFYLNGALVATQTATLPTAVGGPGCHIVNSAAANKSMVLDYFELTVKVVR